jgi:hypothetical protein
MAEYGLNEDQFWNLSPAASEIFRHVETHPDLNERPWRFHGKSGFVTIGRTFVTIGRTGATFSCVSASGRSTDTVFVSAELESDGSWIVEHRIKRAK